MGTKQVKHYRKSKKGRVFKAGSRVYIPPAWKNIKYHKNKPYLVTGVDKKGRTQYIYDKSVVNKNTKDKYRRVEKLKNDINSILNKVTTDMNKGNEEAKVIYVIYKTGFRPGGQDTIADKKAYGVTTLESKHIKVRPNGIVSFKFTGKKGVDIQKDVNDKKIIKLVKTKKKRKNVFDTNIHKVRRYFDNTTNGKYDIKDLRTLKANEIASKVKDKSRKSIGATVAKELGNTPTVALNSYVNPKMIK